jgi:apolipoprotein N-acyltransferase
MDANRPTPMPGPADRAAMTATASDTTTMLERIAAWLEARRGLARLGLAALFGAVAVGALPPLYIVPLIVPAFAGLLWLMRGAVSRWRAFATGWAFGFGYFAAGLYWVTEALLTDPEKFGWMVPIAVPALAAGLAIFIGLAVLAAHLTRLRGVALIIAFAVAWSAAEWLRDVALTGFPWNPVGSVWAFSHITMQSASVVGVFGLGFVTVLAASMPAVLGWRGRKHGRRWRPIVSAFVVLALFLVGGAARLLGSDPGNVPDIRLRIVQANISQTHKWRAALRVAHLERHLKLTSAAGLAKITHVIWPETAAPFFLSIDASARDAIAAVAPRGGLVITGAVRRTARPPLRYWNSLHAIDERGRIVGSYDKHHLVPFGEYVPLRRYLPIKKIAGGDTEFSRGPGAVTLTLPGLPPVSPLICYEAIFPGEVVAPGTPRPGWLLNITNDAWFGTSAGPYQHLAAARFRAVEEGLPLVRAANTGISAVFDAYGREIARLGLGQTGVLDAPLPRQLATRTIFAAAGNWTLLVLLAISTLLAYWCRARSQDAVGKEAE